MTARATTPSNLTGIAAGACGLAAAAAIVAWPAAGLAGTASAALLIGGLAAWIAAQDLKDFTLPDGAILALACLGAALRLAEGGATGEPWSATAVPLALDLLLCGGGLWLLREGFFRWRGRDGIGFGDVKLAAAGGLLAGTTGLAWALLAASLAGLAIVVARRSLRPTATFGDRLAFGALLAPALWLVWLAQRLALGGG